MNWSTKRTIDLSAPAIVAGVVGYFMYKKTQNWRIALISAAVGFLLAYLIVTQVTKRLYTTAPREVQNVKDYSTVDCSSFDGTAIAQAVKKDFDAYWSPIYTGNSAMYNQVLSLSNCELISLYNLWNQKYYTETKVSLRGAFTYMADHGLLRGLFNGDLINAIVQKFIALNLD